MATRNSGRNDDRSNQRNPSGGSGTAGARGTSGGTSGRTASSGSSATGTSRPGTPGGNRAPSGSTAATGTSTQSGSSRNQSASDQSQSQSQSQSTGSSAPSSTTRTDRERELRTSREQAGSQRASSSAQRGGVGPESRDVSPRLFASGGNTPFAMMRRMMDDMDRLFSDFGFMHPAQLAASFFDDNSWTPQRSVGAGSPSGSGIAPQQSRGQSAGVARGGQTGWHPLSNLWSPQVEVFERGSNIVIRADLPGLSRDDVDVEVDNDALIIRGERRNEFEDKQEGYYRTERSYGTFYRAIPLPENVDASSCNATFKDGVLEVSLPKPENQQSRAKRIDVR